ncbi:ribosomal protein S18-alanine N-acetyltransferase [Pseudomonadota bacterium]
MFPESYQLRTMDLQDIDAVMAIEVRAYPHPWTIGNFRDCLSSGYKAYVLEAEGEIIGYALLSCAAGEAHVLNICIRPESQGKGLGRTLLHALEREARQSKVDMMLLEVRASNRAAIMLYESMGFNELGCRKNYYPSHQGREDALVMALQFF